MTKKRIIFLPILILVILILNVPVTTKQGINDELRTLKIPAYVKIIEYFDRDYRYKELVKEIIKDYTTDEEKIIAIFNWTIENIHRVPPGFDIIDDHTLNIIVRRYGTPDQMADVFATLCIYSGIDAFCGFDLLDKGKEWKNYRALSFVLLDSKWRVFNFYHNAFFLNSSGEIANVEDIISGDFVVVKDRGGHAEKAAYENFFKDLKPIKKNFISKAEKQVPLLRLKYEIKRTFLKTKDFFR